MTTGGMTTGHWHGTRKCTVSGAKIPRQQQVAGHRCPFCGHTLGAEFGRSGKATSLETQLDKLQKLHDDGVITDEELRDRRAAVIDKELSAPPAPTGRSLSDDGTKADDKPIWQRPAAIAAGVAVVLLLLVFAGSSGDGGGGRNGGGGDTPLPTNAAVVSRIRSLTDCAELQREFDIAADNHDIQSAQGDLTMMQVSSEYMEIAYDRAESLGCYG